ncbi:MAG: thymidylate kinase [Bacillota bacterium]|nr:thymidylate kinase [Bacillota bacterium]MDD3297449.1 thymidylate kinase [Bacillota bacterium]MDD3850261.1 thymidylate kinase [Bacillota bacterium]MDD4707218.1 thymidylate kinase [Bacillota bacterium]
MKGKLIIIEAGSDASGKATQTAMLYEKLRKEGKNVRKIEFPNYESDSSVFVRMYLDGKFGSDPEAIDPYIVSPMYTLDRYCSYIDGWGNFLRSGGLVIADRYTTSNMVHQASKIDDPDRRDKYLDWLWDFEYGIYKLPVPDLVVFLDVPPGISRRLLIKRSDGHKRDIHEGDFEYLEKTYANALYIAKKYNWQRVQCMDGAGREFLTVREIHAKVYDAVLRVIE